MGQIHEQPSLVKQKQLKAWQVCRLSQMTDSQPPSARAWSCRSDWKCYNASKLNKTDSVIAKLKLPTREAWPKWNRRRDCLLHSATASTVESVLLIWVLYMWLVLCGRADQHTMWHRLWDHDDIIVSLVMNMAIAIDRSIARWSFDEQPLPSHAQPLQRLQWSILCMCREDGVVSLRFREIFLVYFNPFHLLLPWPVGSDVKRVSRMWRGNGRLASAGGRQSNFTGSTKT